MIYQADFTNKVCHEEGGIGKGMGPVPKTKDVQLLHALESDPDSFKWTKPRQVTVYKGKGGLGIRHCFIQGKFHSYMIITKVKEDCCIRKGVLQIFDRIIAVNSEIITNYQKEKVLRNLKQIQEGDVALTVTSLNSEGYTSEGNTIPAAGYSNFDGGKSIDFRKLENVKTPFSNVSKSDDRCTPSCESLNLETYSYELREHNNNNCSSDYGMENHGLFHNGHMGYRNSDESCETVLSADASYTGHRKVKRELSEVSESYSSKSVNSNSPLLTTDDMPRSRSDPKQGGRLVLKTDIIDCSGDSEMEPLQQMDLLSPTPTGRFSNLTVDDPARTYSLPLPKESAVSMQDINVFEEHTQSMPVGHTSHVTGSCESSRMCYNCQTKPGNKPKNTNVGIMLDSQQPLSEDYRNFLLKNPHLAVWDGMNTHVVEIDKGTFKEYGFHYKVMIGKVHNQDTSVEVYTLVASLVKDGPSVGKLRIGDWIRSVNGTAIQNPQQTYELIKQACKKSTMRLIVQRPIGFSQHPNTARSKKSDMYAQVTKPQSPLPSTPSPNYKEQDPLIPGIIEQNVGPEKVIRQQNIYFSEVSSTNNESQSSYSPFPKTVKFPKVRVFVCGSEAEKYGSYLLRDSNVVATEQTSAYTHYQFSMAADCCGNPVISPMLATLYAASNKSNSYRMNCTDYCGSSAGGGDTPSCKQSGCDLNTHSNNLGSVVNVSLFIVPDDKLFHYCCCYLFTKSSLFILTFDGSKILRSASQEVSRLQSLSHTVRSFAGEECYIMSYGLLNGGMEATHLRDEVKTLFYTQMLNTPLQNYKIIGPELINIQGSHCDGDSGSCDELKRLLWKTVTDSIQHQHVLQPALLIVDYLQGCRDIFVTEEHLMSVIKVKLPEYDVDVHQMILTYLNEYGEIILGKATPLFSQCSIGNIVIMSPVFLLSSLYQFISVVLEDKHRWSRTNCTGYFTASDLEDSSGFSGSEIQCRYLTEFLECVQLIYRKPKLNSTHYTEYFLPYFIPLITGTKIAECGKKDLEVYLLFDNHESYQTFYQFIFSLAANSKQPDSLTFQGASSCMFHHEGLIVTAHYLKTEDRVKVVFTFEDKSRLMKPFEIFHWVYSTCENYLLCSLDIQFSVCAPCPLGENCRSDYQPRPHLVDLKESKPQFCCGERIDTMKPIRQWKQREPEGPSVQKQKKAAKTIMYVTDLRWTVFNDVCSKLRIPNALDRDWKGLAGLMGLTTEQVHILELEQNPPKELLKTPKLTMEQLKKYLQELDRVDILEYLERELSQKQGVSASSRSSDNGQPELEATPHSTLPPICNSAGVNLGNNLATGYMNIPGQMLPPIRNSNLTDREDKPDNSPYTPGSIRGSINVAAQGNAAYSGLEEGTDSSKGVGVKLNNLDNNNHVDVVRGICTDSMITPVETPRPSVQIQNN